MTLLPGAGLRTILGLMGVMVLAQLLVVSATLLGQRPAAGELALPGVVDQVRAAADLLDALPSSERPLAVRALQSPLVHFRLIDRFPEDTPAGEPQRRFRRLIGLIEPGLDGRPFRLYRRVERTGQPLYDAFAQGRHIVAVRLTDGSALIVEPSAYYRRRALLSVLAMAGSLLCAAIMLILAVSARATTRPLRRMAHRADAFSARLDAPAMPETGPPAVATLAQAFNRMQDRLRGLVAERTRTLAAVAHDMRTYLTRLRMRAEFIGDEAQRDKAIRDLDDMSRLIDDALLIGREAHDDRPAECLDPAALVSELAAVRREAGQPVSVAALPALACRVLAKRSTLRRAVDNLVDNAIRYGEQAEICVECDDDEVVIRILDTGPGVPETEIERLCEPFFRLDGSRSRETGGAGLGLAIARAGAEQCGGRLRLRNRPEGGLDAQIILARAETQTGPGA